MGITDEIKISVILPVYNVEPWIGDCIESLKKQRQDGLEFIFVDDCSTDNSIGVVEDWAAKDNRVRIIHNKENIGQGPSRNRGIEIARGEYLSFIDPDDWVCDVFYEKLYSKAKETGCDIVKGVRIYLDGRKSNVNKTIQKRTRKKKPLFLCFTYEHQTAIFKRTLFTDGTICYGESRNAQDVVFLLKICHETESIAIVSDSVYYYRIREKAATSNYSMKRSWNEMKTLEEMIDYLDDKPIDYDHVEYISVIMQSYLSRYYYATQCDEISKEAQEEYYRIFCSVAAYLEKGKWLRRNYPEIQIFINHKYVIPYEARIGDTVFYTGVKRWTDFFVNHSDELKDWHYLGYSTALARFRLTNIRAKRSKDFYKEQLYRLPAKKRRKIIRLLPRAVSFKVMKKIK